MFVHKTAVIDEKVILGQNISIWHFCHVMEGSNIGDGSILGQNVKSVGLVAGFDDFKSDVCLAEIGFY